MMCPLPQRFRDRSFFGPTCLKSLTDNPGLESKAFRPLSNGQSFAIHFDNMVGAGVIGLLDSGSPPAVESAVQGAAFLALSAPIAAFIINSVNRMFVARTGTHIVKEVLEVFPPRAHFNSASAIVRVTGHVFLHSALMHCSPGAVFRCPALGDKLSSLCAVEDRAFCATLASGWSAFLKMIEASLFDATAFAATCDIDDFAAFACWPNDCSTADHGSIGARHFAGASTRFEVASFAAVRAWYRRLLANVVSSQVAFRPAVAEHRDDETAVQVERLTGDSVLSDPVTDEGREQGYLRGIAHCWRLLRASRAPAGDTARGKTTALKFTLRACSSLGFVPKPVLILGGTP